MHNFSMGYFPTKKEWEELDSPGKEIVETACDLNLDPLEIGKQLGIEGKALLDLILGAGELTPAIALRLEQVLGIQAEVWLLMEAHWRKKHPLQKKPWWRSWV